MGGFDVFQTKGQENNWTYPENMGMPVNSSADDYFFALTPNGGAGFLASNRVFGGQKITTTNDDLFFFSSGSTSSPVTIRGEVLDETTGLPVTSVSASVFRMGNGSQEQLVESEGFDGGAFRFQVPAGQEYRIEVSSYGYITNSYVVATDIPGEINYSQSTYLRPNASTPGPVVTDDPEPTTPDPEPTNPGPPPVTNVSPGELMPGSGGTYTARGKGDRDNFEYSTSAPRYRGTYYRVQLIALGNYNPSNPAFDGVKTVGPIYTEKLLSKKLTRVLVGDYFSLSEAQSALTRSQDNGFGNAYIVRYEDGDRYGKLPK